MNIILKAYEPAAATVFGVYFKLQSFVYMPVFGMNNGIVPIEAYNGYAEARCYLLSCDNDSRTAAVPAYTGAVTGNVRSDGRYDKAR